MGIIYVFIVGIFYVLFGSYVQDMLLIVSSEEWKDKGVVVSFRWEVDVEGRIVIKFVKKGVRDFLFGRIFGEGFYSIVYFVIDC